MSQSTFVTFHHPCSHKTHRDYPFPFFLVLFCEQIETGNKKKTSCYIIYESVCEKKGLKYVLIIIIIYFFRSYLNIFNKLYIL